MKPDFMKHAVLVPFLVCAASLAVRAEAILGRFQPEDEVARAVVGLTGPARVNLNAVRIVDLAGRAGAADGPRTGRVDDGEVSARRPRREQRSA